MNLLLKFCWQVVSKEILKDGLDCAFGREGQLFNSYVILSTELGKMNDEDDELGGNSSQNFCRLLS